MRAAPRGRVQFRSETYRHAGGRGRIKEFSPRSRRRLREAAFDLNEFHAPELLVTLTYPGEWRSVASSGPACKRHLRAFRRRLERYFAQFGITDWSALWFLEFQKRGAPHYHLILWGSGLSLVDLEHARVWLSDAWSEIVGHSDAGERRRHRSAGTRVEQMRTKSFGYAVSYAAKPHQKKVPEGFEQPGRWWGLWQAVVPAPITFSGHLSLAALERVVERLAETIRPHSERFADALPGRVLGVVGRGWPSAVRIYGKEAAQVALAVDVGTGPPL